MHTRQPKIEESNSRAAANRNTNPVVSPQKAPQGKRQLQVQVPLQLQPIPGGWPEAFKPDSGRFSRTGISDKSAQYNSAKTTAQLKQGTPGTNHLKVVQRQIIDSSTYEHTTRYGINPAGRGVLYGVNNAAEPQPTGLYAQKQVNDTGPGGFAVAWKPNVTFLNKAQKSLAFEGNQMVYTNEEGQKQQLDLAAMKEKVEMPKVGKHEKSPVIGMMGQNDCAQFATTLYNAIARAGYQQQQDSGELTELILKEVVKYPKIEVGDMMQHIFDDGGRCPWHAATVVAKDNGALITLEANVVEEIDAPDFYIHHGAEGFVKNNDPEADESGKGKPRGRRMNITRYHSGKPPSKDLKLYDELDNTYEGTYRLKGGVYTTPPQQELTYRLLTRMLTSGAAAKFWKEQTLNPFSDDMPDGITSMRQTIAQDFEGTVADGGGRWLSDKPFSRSVETNIFYRILHEYNPERPGDTLETLNRFAKMYNI